MRPIAHFTLHAALATALIAFAATGAAAAAADGKSSTWIRVSQQPAGGSMAGAGEQIEIHSFHWGPRQSAGVNRMTMDDTAGKEQGRGGTATVDANEKITVHGGRTEGLIGQAIGNLASEGNEDSAGAAGKRTPPTVTLKRGMNRGTETTGGKAPSGTVMKGSRIGENSTASHYGRGVDIAAVDGQISPAGGDPDRPVIAGNVPNPSSPPATGVVRVKVKLPWLGCRAGAFYPSLELADGGKRYLLQDVTVASCGRSSSGDADDRPTEEVAFYYNKIAFNYASSPAKVQVRGWDPKKKEE